MPKSIKKKTFHLTFAVDMTVMRSEKSVCLIFGCKTFRFAPVHIISMVIVAIVL